MIGRDRVLALSQHDFDITGTVCTKGSRRRVRQLAHGRSTRMTESVARTDTHQRPLGTQGAQQRRRHGSRTPVMTYLEHVDLADGAVARERLENVVLCIAGKQRAEALGIRSQHHAGLIRGGIRNSRPWPDAPERDATNTQHVTGCQLANRARARQRHCLRKLGLKHTSGTCRHTHDIRLRESVQGTKATIVIGVQMGDHDRVQSAHPLATKHSAKGGLTRPGVDQNSAWSVPDQDRIALTHVADLNRSSATYGGADRQV